MREGGKKGGQNRLVTFNENCEEEKLPHDGTAGKGGRKKC